MNSKHVNPKSFKIVTLKIKDPVWINNLFA